MHFPSVPRAARLAAALAVALSPTLHAQQATRPGNDTRDARRVDAIVVVGVPPADSVQTETNPKLPRQPVPASDGADYLKTIPGFAALRNGGSNGDPVLRGLSGSRLNLLANDGAMHGACPARMDNAMSYVAPETFDRLVVTKGPQTVLWGPGASAGTVRFERDREHYEERSLRMDGSLLAGGFGRRDAVFDGRMGSGAGYLRVNGNRSRADDYRDGHGDAVPSAWDKWNADAALGWTPSEHVLVEADFGRGNGRARYAGRGMDGSRFLRDSRGLRVEADDLPGALDSLSLQVYRNDADHVMDNYTLRTPNPKSAMPMPMASNVARATRGARAALAWATPRWAGSLGLDMQSSLHRSRSAAGRDAWRARPWQEDARFANSGVFGELTWNPLASHRVVAGARLDRARVRDLRATIGSGMMARPNPTRGGERVQSLHSGFVRYEFGAAGAAWQGFAGIGHVARMPDYWELFSPTVGPTGAPNAFAGIRPERTTQLDLGLQRRGAAVDAWVTAYAGRIRDFVLFSTTPGGMMGMGTRAANVDAGTHGLEAGGEWRVGDGWKLGGSVAWAWGDNRTQRLPLPQVPPLDARLHASWQGARWAFGGMLRGVARQSRVAPGMGNVSGRDLGPSAGFGVLSANAAYRLGGVATVSAGVDNLLDRAYSEHLNLAGNADFGYPADPVRIAEPGRTLWMKVNLSY